LTKPISKALEWTILALRAKQVEPWWLRRRNIKQKPYQLIDLSMSSFVAWNFSIAQNAAMVFIGELCIPHQACRIKRLWLQVSRYHVHFCFPPNWIVAE
jgi:hypothetical protein